MNNHDDDKRVQPIAIATMYDGLLSLRADILSVYDPDFESSLSMRSRVEQLQKAYLDTPDYFDRDEILITCFQYVHTGDFAEASLLVTQLSDYLVDPAHVSGFGFTIDELGRVIEPRREDWFGLSYNGQVSLLATAIRSDLRRQPVEGDPDAYWIAFDDDMCSDLHHAITTLYEISTVDQSTAPDYRRRILEKKAQVAMSNLRELLKMLDEAANGSGMNISVFK